MNFENKRIKLDPYLEEQTLKNSYDVIENEEKYPFEQVVVKSDIKMDLKDVYMKKETEERNENPQVAETELEKAKMMYKTGKDPFEAERKQAILHYVQNEIQGGIPAQNIDHQVGTETIASTSHQSQPSRYTCGHLRRLRQLRCMKCQYATVQSSDFVDHWLKHRTESYRKVEPVRGEFACAEEECRVVTTSTIKLLEHVRLHNLYNYQCDFCHYVTYFKRDFLLHIDLHDIFQCTVCELQSTKQIFVQDHLEYPWSCPECEFTAHHWFIINKHIYSHDFSSSALFICELCSFISTSESVMQQHRLIHKKHFVPCKMCDFKTKNMDILAKHYEYAHSTTREAADKILRPLIKCKFCDCVFKNETFLRRHRALHKEKGPAFKCNHCAHFGSDTEDAVYQCPYCGSKKNHLHDIHSHIMQSHPTELQLEGFGYAKGTNAPQHDQPENSRTVNAERMKEGGEVLPDKTSGKTAVGVNALEEVIKEKTVVLQYQCDFCYYMTISDEEYAEHRKSHIIFKCTECSLESAKKLFVEDHTEDTYTCKSCHFKAHHWLLMRSHIFSHKYANFPILSCTFCKFMTRSPVVLSKHNEIHERQEVKCLFCHLKTTNMRWLQQHLIKCHKTILELKPAPDEQDELHKCEFCECKFKHPIYLYKHQALHTENGPNFKCSQCVHPSSSSRKNNELWTFCPYCNYHSYDIGKIIEHMVRKHEVSLETECYRFENSNSNETSKLETMVSPDETSGLLNCMSTITSHPDQAKKQKRSRRRAQKKNLKGVERNEEVMIHAQTDGAPVKARLLPAIPADMTKNKENDIEADIQAVVHPQVQACQQKGAFDTRATDTAENSIKVVNTNHTVPSGAYIVDKTSVERTLLSTSISDITKSVENKELGIDRIEDRQARVFNARTTDISGERMQVANTKHALPSGAYIFLFHAEENVYVSQAQRDQIHEIKIENIQEASEVKEEEKPDPKMTSDTVSLQDEVVFQDASNRNMILDTIIKEDKDDMINQAFARCDAIQKDSDVIDLTDDNYDEKAQTESTMIIPEPLEPKERTVFVHCAICFYTSTTTHELEKHIAETHVTQEPAVDEHEEKLQTEPEPQEPTEPKIALCCPICFHTPESDDQLEKHMAETHASQETINGEVELENEASDSEYRTIFHCSTCFYTSHSEHLFEEHMRTNHNAAEVEITVEKESEPKDDVDQNNLLDGVVDGMIELSEDEEAEVEAIHSGESGSVGDSTQERDPLEDDVDQNNSLGRVVDCIDLSKDEEVEIEAITCGEPGSNQLKIALCCPICFHTPGSDDQLEKHMAETHASQETVRGKVELENEALDSEKRSIFHCPVCFYTSHSEHLFEEHMSTNHAADVDQNNLLGGVVDGINELSKDEEAEVEATHSGESGSVGDSTHEEIDPLKAVWSCSVCSYSSNKLNAFNDHIAHIHGIGTRHPYYKDDELQIGWYCPVCHYTSNSEHFLNEHLAAKHKLKMSQRNGGTESQSDHARPGFYMAGSEWYCARCNYTADSIIVIEQHIAQKHPSEEEEWSCSVCCYTAPIEFLLKEHMHTRNLSQLPLKKSAPTKHLQKWRCEYCTYTTTKSAYFLSKHVVTVHKWDSIGTDQEKKVPCKQARCHFKASSVDELSVHMTQHLQSTMMKVLTYKCERCGFGSLSKSIFSRHRRRCASRPWYKCYHCHYMRKNKSALKTHLTEMHQYSYKRKRGFECQKCGFRTKKKDLIDLHYKRNYSNRCVEER